MTHYTRDDLRGMTPKQVNDAHAAGLLDHLLRPGVKPRTPPDPERQVMRTELSSMTPAEIATAYTDGRLTALLSGTAEPSAQQPQPTADRRGERKTDTTNAQEPQPTVGLRTQETTLRLLTVDDLRP